METKLHSNAARPTSASTLRSYVTGFVLSVTLTITAYTVVTRHIYTRHGIAAAVAGLAIAQFLVQLLFFLHLGRETKPRWKFMALIGMMIVVGIVVVGSYWIMYNLNHHMLSPSDVNSYMRSQDGL